MTKKQVNLKKVADTIFLLMKKIFSFGEKPYKEFRLARPGEVKNILKEKHVKKELLYKVIKLNQLPVE